MKDTLDIVSINYSTMVDGRTSMRRVKISKKQTISTDRYSTYQLLNHHHNGLLEIAQTLFLLVQAKKFDDHAWFRCYTTSHPLKYMPISLQRIWKNGLIFHMYFIHFIVTFNGHMNGTVSEHQVCLLPSFWSRPGPPLRAKSGGINRPLCSVTELWKLTFY